MATIDLFRALGDPTRRAVFERLATGEASVSELTRAFAVSQPAISQHLATLKSAGLVRERRDGRFTVYGVDTAGLSPLVDWVDRYRAFWPERIERLRDLVGRMDR